MKYPKLSTALWFVFSLSLIACSPGPESSIQVAKQGVLSGSLAADGSHALVASVHHGGSYWRVDGGERLYDWNHKAGDFSLIRAGAISGNGRRAVTAEENTLVLWDTQTGKSLQFWQTPARVLDITLNNDGSRALMGLLNFQVVYFDMNRGQAIHTFEHQGEVRTVDMDAEGRIGISGSDDFNAKLWDLRGGKELNTFVLENQIKTVALSNSGSLAFITAQREDTSVIDTQSGETKFSFANRYTNYTAAAFSDDEQNLALGNFQGEIETYSIGTGKTTNKWQAKPRQAYGSATSKAILDIAFSGDELVALTSDGQIQRFK